MRMKWPWKQVKLIIGLREIIEARPQAQARPDATQAVFQPPRFRKHDPPRRWFGISLALWKKTRASFGSLAFAPAEFQLCGQSQDVGMVFIVCNLQSLDGIQFSALTLKIHPKGSLREVKWEHCRPKK
jgi:hypothetical protein